MIKSGWFPNWAFTTLWLGLCLKTVASGHGKQILSEHHKKKDCHDLKLPSQLEVRSPEMVLLSGAQRNDLNLAPLVEGLAPQEAYRTKPGEKPIIISVSKDKQVLSEEERMLPKPILVDGSVANWALLRRSCIRNSSPAQGTGHGAQGTRHEAQGTRHEAQGTRHEAQGSSHYHAAAAAVSGNSPTATMSSKTASVAEEKTADLGQLKRNEMRPNLAALHRDDTAGDGLKDSPENFNESLSSDQLLCIIFKLLSMYKPNFTGTESHSSHSGSSKTQKYSYAENPPTLKPIKSELYDLAQSQDSNLQMYKSNWQSSDFPSSSANKAQKEGDLDLESLPAQKCAGILDAIPLMKSFNKFTPNLSGDPELSILHTGPGNRTHPLPELDIQYRKLRKELQGRSAKMSSHEVKGHGDSLKVLASVTSNPSEKKSVVPVFSPGLPEETLNLYSKLLEQLQSKKLSHNIEDPDFSGDLLKTLAQIQRTGAVGRNQSSAIPELEFFSNYMKAHPDDIHRNYGQLLRYVSPIERQERKTKKRPISAHAEQTNDSDLLDACGLDLSDDSDSHTKGSNHHRGKQSGKKFHLQLRRRSKEERRKKTHDFDFLDLLSKSMVRESRNFFGRI